MRNAPIRSRFTLGRALFLLLVLVMLYPYRVTIAQDVTQSRRYSLVLQGVPLEYALEQLVSKTRIDLAYYPSLVANKRVHCVLENAVAEDLLRCVIQDTHLDFYRLSSGQYVITEVSEASPLYGELTGIVIDAETRQPLPYAHVVLAESLHGTTSNQAGLFAFARLKPGRYVVIAMYAGYRNGAKSIQVPPGGNAQTQLALQSEPYVLETIVVDGQQWRLPSSELGSLEMTQDDLARNPSTGASSIIAGLNSMLGVRVSDATADVHLQGGETGEHQLRLDGAPVFLPLNFAGFIGPFSPYAVGRMTVHKAGFGTSKGSQISGIIDIEQGIPLRENQHLDMQFDPLSLNGRLGFQRGTIDHIHASYMIAGRWGLWDLYAPKTLESLLQEWNKPDPFLRAAFDRAQENAPFDTLASYGNPQIGFFDLHGSSRVRFGLLRSLHSSFYWGESQLGSDLTEPSAATAGMVSNDPLNQTFRDLFHWKTGVAQSRYETVVGPRLLLTSGVRGSYYKVEHNYNVPDSLVQSEGIAGEISAGSPISASIRPDDGNRVHEVAAYARADYALGSFQNLEIGIDMIHTGSDFVVLGTQRFPIRHRSSGWRIGHFVEDNISIGKYVAVELGSRLTYLHSHRKVYTEPRFSLRFDRVSGIIGPWSLFLSTGIYRQFTNQFDVSSRSPGSILPSTRFWLVADSTIRPPKATHYAFEWLLRPGPLWSIRVEGYYKEQHHILAIDYASQAGENEQNQQQIDFLKSSKGFVRGIGFQLQWKSDPGRLEASYEHSLAKRSISDLFGGELHRAPWNEPHRLELATDWIFFKHVSVLARWYGVWGRTWGFRQAYYDFLGALESVDPYIPQQVNARIKRQVDFHGLKLPDNHTLPPIHQLDLSFAYALSLGKAALQARVDILNVLNRTNISEYYLVYDPDIYYGEGEMSGFLSRANNQILPRHISIAVKLSW